MPAIILAIVKFLGLAIGLIGGVWDIVNKFLTSVSTLVANSKLFLTIILLGIVLAVFTVCNSILDWILDINYSETFGDTISVGLLQQLCDWRKLVSLATWCLSYWITEKVFLTSMFSYRLLSIFVGKFGSAIKI